MSGTTIEGSYNKKLKVLARRRDWIISRVGLGGSSRDQEEIRTLCWAIEVIEANKDSAKLIIQKERMEKNDAKRDLATESER